MTAKKAATSQRFAPALSRYFKTKEGRYLCRQTEDGDIYATNGVILVKLTPAEYDAVIRPITMTDPGNWSQTPSATLPAASDSLNLAKLWADTISDTKSEPLRLSPLSINTPAKHGRPYRLALFHGLQSDFVAGYNSAFLEIVAADGAEYRAAGPRSPMMIYTNGDPAALVMPVHIDDKSAIRAARAYFTNTTEAAPAMAQPAEWEAERNALFDRLDAAENHAAAMETQRDELQKRLDEMTRHAQSLEAQASNPRPEDAERMRALSERVEALQDELNETTTQRDALRATLSTAAPIPAATATPGDKAAALVDKLAALGLTVTVKGAQTAAPVLWIEGDPGAHKADLESMGGRYSQKREAWYIKAA